MLVWKKILWLRDRIASQTAWIKQCGGDHAGYEDRYGNPGLPPKDLQGENPPETRHLPFRTTKRIPKDHQNCVADLKPVFDTPDNEFFYLPHLGHGGTAIFEADTNRLRIWQQELGELMTRNYAASVKADEMAAKGYKVKE
jgi:hypothetical protein